MTVDPLARHRALTDGVVAAGDPHAIKQLYVELGQDWWEAHADELDAIPVLSAPETHPVVARVLGGVAGLVLDAGCGPNPAISLSLAGSPQRSVVVLDIGWGTVRVASRVAQVRGLHLLGVVGDVEHLPFRSSAFDGVVCDDTIEHLPDDRLGVVELARVSRPGATVVLATPNRLSADILRQKLRDRVKGTHRPADRYFVATSHLREYTWREFEQLISPVLRVRRRAPVGWRRGWKSRLATRLVVIPPLHHLSQMIVLVTEPR
jgi:SAM-dependent methyltransferase